jgi:4-diphosphocytidyl-2-C-methyl-D-erythritol kinase
MEVRTALLRSLAKVNLDLRILHKRTDGYHELRSVFQTISLSDTIRLSYTPSSRSSITIEGNVVIADNLIAKAAEAILQKCKLKGLIHCELNKVIPMGGGVGGGSSNAAAILLALPVLAGKIVALSTLEKIASSLGSDITYFLHGGAVFGLGRGTELYPIPDQKTRRGWLVAPGLHVATGQAYADLQRDSNEMPVPEGFQQFMWNFPFGSLSGSTNDFESIVYKRYPKLRMIHRKLEKAGASFVRMSGSGSSIFAFFDQKPPDRSILEGYSVYPIETVSRRQYQKLWRHQLQQHITPGEIWPPQSRYAQ